MSWICTHCQGTAEEGVLTCPHCGMVIPAADLPLGSKQEQPDQTPASETGIAKAEWPWQSQGMLVGLLAGILLVLVTIEPNDERSPLEICFTMLIGGFVASLFGAIAGIGLGALFSPREVDEQALESAMDNHREIERGWSARTDDSPRPASADNKTQVTRDLDGIAPSSETGTREPSRAKKPGP